MNIRSIVNGRLCAKCGMCFAVCPASAIAWGDDDRPRVTDGCTNCGLCQRICPGGAVAERSRTLADAADIAQATAADGVPQLWVGAAADLEVRRNAASGGFVTAFTQDLLARGVVDGVIVTSGDAETPLKNRSSIASTREELLAAMGSRYAPSPTCAALRGLDTGRRYVFVGKPCDVDAVRRLQAQNNKYECIALTIGLMCAGVPKPSALAALLRDNGISPGEVKRIRYRGGGWPGTFAVERADGSQLSMPYHDAWGKYLSRERSVRCNLCDDPFALSADIVAGDPWGDEYAAETEGLSLVLLRSAKGAEAFHTRKDGAFDARPLPVSDLMRLQSGFVKKFGNHPVERAAYNIVVGRRLKARKIPDGLRGMYRLARRVAFYIVRKPD